MAGPMSVLIPAPQRQTVDEVAEALDLGRGHVVAKRSGFLILLVLSAVIAICWRISCVACWRTAPIRASCINSLTSDCRRMKSLPTR